MSALMLFILPGDKKLLFFTFTFDSRKRCHKVGMAITKDQILADTMPSAVLVIFPLRKTHK